MNRRLQGAVLILLSACGYAVLPIFVKLAYQTNRLRPYDLLTWRFIIAVSLIGLLSPLWRSRAQIGALRRTDLFILLGMGAMFAGFALVAFISLEYIQAMLFTLLFYTYPAVTALIMLALGERLPTTAWLAIMLALAGSALTGLGGGDQGLVISNAWDVAMPVLNAVAYAIYLVLAQRRVSHLPGLTSAIVSIVGSLIALVLMLPVFKTLITPVGPTEWLPLVGLATFSTLMATLCMFMGVARIGASQAATLSTVEPVITIALAAWLLGERAAPLQYGGGALILLSVILLSLPARASSAVKPID